MRGTVPLRISRWKLLSLCSSPRSGCIFLTETDPDSAKPEVGRGADSHDLASVKQKLPVLILILRRGLQITGKSFFS
jgi:hypothetical protein